MLDEGIFKMERYVESGWLTGLKYEDEILADLEKRTDSKPNKLKAVSALPHCTLHYLTCICHNTSSTHLMRLIGSCCHHYGLLPGFWCLIVLLATY